MDVANGRMSDQEYQTAIAELANRQVAAAAETTPQTAARVKEMRRVLAWHLHKVSIIYPPPCHFHRSFGNVWWVFGTMLCLSDQSLALLSFHGA